jgi:uncharacterized protein YgiM (DUF1202 family)
MPAIPDPDALISHYPTGDAEAVKRQIGGAVNAEWITNTCAVRMSRSFNQAGTKVPGNVSYMNTVKGGDGNRYAFRVKEFRQWLENKYGKPTLEARGDGTTNPPSSFRGLKGIICFVDCGWSDATGHLDLWDGQKCVGHAYFEYAKSILLWCPKAPPPPPPSSGGGSGVRTGRVTATSLNVRSQPNSSASVIGTLARGAQVSIFAERNGFYQIAADGWVSRQYVS